MKVTIKTQFGKMKFSMTQDQAMDLIRRAAEYSTSTGPDMSAPPCQLRGSHSREDGEGGRGEGRAGCEKGA